MGKTRSWLAVAAVASALLAPAVAEAQWLGGTPYTGGPWGGGPWGYPNGNGYNGYGSGWGRGNGNLRFSADLGVGQRLGQSMEQLQQSVGRRRRPLGGSPWGGNPMGGSPWGGGPGAEALGRKSLGRRSDGRNSHGWRTLGRKSPGW